MKYITSLEMAERVGKTKRWINDCCARGVIKGAYKKGNRWMIPDSYKWEVGSTFVKEESSYAARKYLNPGNEGFVAILNGNYIDKTGLIDLVNSTVGTAQNLTCISRPRRFGKSFAAKMLCAYYDCTCDSRDLFKNYEISKSKSFGKHLNKYNVIYLDITGFISELKVANANLSDIASNIMSAIIGEINATLSFKIKADNLQDALLQLVYSTGRKIVFIIDEWDAVIREAKDDLDTQKAFLNLLRGIFKNGNLTPKVVAAAYMTGILPIKKDGMESAISDFLEYTVLNPGDFAKYTGFTEDEVEKMCKENGQDFSLMKEWYDGYSFAQADSIYNPYSVMMALRMKSFESYWQKTSAAESLATYIEMNFEGLQDDIVRLISGECLEVNVNNFGNDIYSFKNKDDVLTLMVHLGYLAYDNAEKTVRIPNKEVKSEFESLLKTTQNKKLIELVNKSECLLKDTLDGKAKAVAKAIDEIRESAYAPTFYNNEQALRYVIKFAYVVCVDKYMRIEELPSGKGIADVVYLPKKNTNLPALIIELKWNKSGKAAIAQIKDNKYPTVLKDYVGDIILVGINYNADSKTHDCKIEILYNPK